MNVDHIKDNLYNSIPDYTFQHKNQRQLISGVLTHWCDMHIVQKITPRRFFSTWQALIYGIILHTHAFKHQPPETERLFLKQEFI